MFFWLDRAKRLAKFSHDSQKYDQPLIEAKPALLDLVECITTGNEWEKIMIKKVSLSDT